MTRLSGNYLLNSRAISNINQCSSKVKTTYFVWWTSVNLHPVSVKMSKQNKLPYGSILVPKNNWRLTWACFTHLVIHQSSLDFQKKIFYSFHIEIGLLVLLYPTVAEILLKLVLNTNYSINQSINQSKTSNLLS